MNMLPETIARLADIPEVVAVKEASGSLAQMAEVVQLAGEKITLLAGDDNVILPVLSLGGKGVISVIANMVPGQTADIIRTWEEGDINRARDLFYGLLPPVQGHVLRDKPYPCKDLTGAYGKN